jgi:DNA-binding CsgD family transcriptional regulator
VRTHLSDIYAKRDAHNRSEAVSRARELGLLSSTSIVR